MDLSDKREMAVSNLSTKRPTQLSKIYMRKGDFEDSFIKDLRIQCDDIEKNLDIVLPACRRLIDKRFVRMRNKRVWYDRDTAALYPKNYLLPYCEMKLYNGKLHLYEGVEDFDYQSQVLTVDGIEFVLASPEEGVKTFHIGNGNPYLDEFGNIAHYPTNPAPFNKAFFITDDYAYDSTYMRFYCTGSRNHRINYNSNQSMFMIMISRLDGKNSLGLNPVKTLLAWLQKGLMPEGLQKEERLVYNKLLSSYQNFKTYLDYRGDHISFRREAFIDDVCYGYFQKETSQCNVDLSRTIVGVSSGSEQTIRTLLLLSKKSARMRLPAGKFRTLCLQRPFRH